MGENGLDFYLSYVQTLQNFLLEIPSCPKKDIFVTEFVIWGNFMKQGKWFSYEDFFLNPSVRKALFRLIDLLHKWKGFRLKLQIQ